MQPPNSAPPLPRLGQTQIQPPGGRLLTAISLPAARRLPQPARLWGAASRGFAAVPPPSPPAGPLTGPLRAVPLGQPGPNAAAGQGSAAVPLPPPPPRPGPHTGPLRAVPLGQPGADAAAGQGSAAVPLRHRADSAHAPQAVDGPLREVHRTRSPALRTGDDHSGPPSRDLSPVRRSLHF